MPDSCGGGGGEAGGGREHTFSRPSEREPGSGPPPRRRGEARGLWGARWPRQPKSAGSRPGLPRCSARRLCSRGGGSGSPVSSVQTGTCARALATPGDGAAAADEILQLGRDGLLPDKCPRPLAGGSTGAASSSPARTWDMAATRSRSRSRGLSRHLPRPDPASRPQTTPGGALDLPRILSLGSTLHSLPCRPSPGREGAGLAGLAKPFPLDGSIAPEMPTCASSASPKALAPPPFAEEKNASLLPPRLSSEPARHRQRGQLGVAVGAASKSGAPSRRA